MTVPGMAVLCDYPEEGWPSMDLCAEMLLSQLGNCHADRVRAVKYCPSFRRRLGRLVPAMGRWWGENADRLLNRFWDYPHHLRPRRKEFDAFHICDHSYAHLVHALPAERTGVYCHDLDAFRCLLEPGLEPRPRWFRAMARRGIRTIVNLRGERLSGSYRLERAACERYGIALVNFHIRARRAPSRDELKATVELFERIEYPILIHCKSGADRTGLISALYSFLKEGVPLGEARRQLSLRYGYLRHSRSGILDLFFANYLEDNQRCPVTFIEWVDKVYDPEKLRRLFHEKRWVNRLTRRWPGAS